MFQDGRCGHPLSTLVQVKGITKMQSGTNVIERLQNAHDRPVLNAHRGYQTTDCMSALWIPFRTFVLILGGLPRSWRK